MQKFHAPDGKIIAFSNGAMATLYHAWWMVARLRLPPATAQEDAVVAWLGENAGSVPHAYAYAFALAPLDPALATSERLAYLAKVIRFAAADLADGASPDEALWDDEVAWEPERQAHWQERQEALARLVDAAAGTFQSPRAARS